MRAQEHFGCAMDAYAFALDEPADAASPPRATAQQRGAGPARLHASFGRVLGIGALLQQEGLVAERAVRAQPAAASGLMPATYAALLPLAPVPDVAAPPPPQYRDDFEEEEEEHAVDRTPKEAAVVSAALPASPPTEPTALLRPAVLATTSAAATQPAPAPAPAAALPAPLEAEVPAPVPPPWQKLALAAGWRPKPTAGAAAVAAGGCCRCRCRCCCRCCCCNHGDDDGDGSDCRSTVPRRQFVPALATWPSAASLVAPLASAALITNRRLLQSGIAGGKVAAAALEPAALSSHPTVLIARARADAALRAELRALTDHLGTPPHTTPAPQP